LTTKQILLNVKRCRRMWEWLSAHPAADKVDYFVAHKIPEDKQPLHACYACEVSGHGYCEVSGHGYESDTKPETVPTCAVNDCFLNSLWPYGCLEMGSPFVAWRDNAVGGMHTRAYSAMLIADACTPVIKKLEGKLKRMKRRTR